MPVWLRSSFGVIFTILCLILAIIIAIIATLIIGICYGLSFLRLKLYRHHIVIDIDRTDQFNKLKRMLKKEYGVACFVKPHIIYVSPDSYWNSVKCIVGASVCFLRTSDAVHFKLTHI